MTVSATRRFPHQVDIPEGTSGEWRVEQFTIDRTQASWSSLIDRGRGVLPGTYTRLVRGQTVVMSDTPAEIRDHYPPIWRARNRCRVHGLGLESTKRSLAATKGVLTKTKARIAAGVCTECHRTFKDLARHMKRHATDKEHIHELNEAERLTSTRESLDLSK